MTSKLEPCDRSYTLGLDLLSRRREAICCPETFEVRPFIRSCSLHFLRLSGSPSHLWRKVRCLFEWERFLESAERRMSLVAASVAHERQSRGS